MFGTLKYNLTFDQSMPLLIANCTGSHGHIIFQLLSKSLFHSHGTGIILQEAVIFIS